MTFTSQGFQLYVVTCLSSLVGLALFNLVAALNGLRAQRRLVQLISKLVTQIPPDDGGI